MRWNWLAATVAIAGAAGMAFTGVEGWGWFLFVAVLLAGV